MKVLKTTSKKRPLSPDDVKKILKEIRVINEALSEITLLYFKSKNETIRARYGSIIKELREAKSLVEENGEQS